MIMDSYGTNSGKKLDKNWGVMGLEGEKGWFDVGVWEEIVGLLEFFLLWYIYTDINCKKHNLAH